MPDTNHLTISILAAVAEDEARRISERTKSALEAAGPQNAAVGSSEIQRTSSVKPRGGLWGRWRGRLEPKRGQWN